MPFVDRRQAGCLLAEALLRYRDRSAIVLGLPCGGLPVAAEVADALRAPLGQVVSRKLGAPHNAAFALGAVTARGTRVLNHEALRFLHVPAGYLAAETERQRRLAAEAEREVLPVKAPLCLMGRVVILVDDGVATGMTVAAAVRDVRSQGPSHLVVAAPVMAPGAYEALERLADDQVAVQVPPYFYAVGQFYQRYEPVGAPEVRAIIGARRGR